MTMLMASSLLKCADLVIQVSRFALAVCRFVLPEGFWGSPDNVRHMRSRR